ncbi:MAG TPA: glycoside hydrolase family 5 protein [Gemmataceae bacterium]|jgi:endoglucanase|nr:glycoside hydrolase family 5 protein [Gemmataceae bacterium]
MKKLVLIALVPMLAAGLLTATRAAPSADGDKDAFSSNRALGRGINLGNALEAPREGAWGLTLKEEYFRLIKRAGFGAVRIPIRWSAHAGDKPPFEIDPAFFKRVDWAIDQALSRDLVVVLNVHHYDEMFTDPAKHLSRLTALWRQIARRYRKQPDRLFFELLNEPHGALTSERWRRMIPRLLAAIRESNPRRIVIVGPGEWNNVRELEKLSLPAGDRRLIVTFHYYSPMEFTHQGADWVPGSRKWKGTTWKGTPRQQDVLRKDIERAAAWGKKHHRPLFLGEFGAYAGADMDSRACWMGAVAREAEQHGISWSYWEFGAGFGIYDPKAEAWHDPLLQALVGKAR